MTCSSAVAGDDVLIGGAGDDVLIGGGGNDVLQAAPGDDVVIQGFAAGAGLGDTLDLSGRGFTFDWLMAHTVDVDGNAVLDLGGQHITFDGVSRLCVESGRLYVGLSACTRVEDRASTRARVQTSFRNAWVHSPPRDREITSSGSRGHVPPTIRHRRRVRHSASLRVRWWRRRWNRQRAANLYCSNIQ